MIFITALMLLLGSMTNDPTRCLPKDIKADDVVSATMIDGTKEGRKLRKVTVADELKNIGARCVDGKLVDKDGKEIRFFKVTGCWGNPPEDYQEILDRQQRELNELKKTFHVIEMTCNPEGVLIH